MKKFALLFLVLVGFSAFSQTTEGMKKNDGFILILDLYPSFESYTEVEIRTLNRTQIKIKTLRKSNYNFMVNDSVALNDSDLDIFYNSLPNISLKTIKTETSSGLDGIGINCTYYSDGEINRFQFWSPAKSTTEHQIIDSIVRLLESKFQDETYSNYFNSLKKYYGY